MLALAASMRRGCRGLHCSAHLTQAELEIDGVPGPGQPSPHECGSGAAGLAGLLSLVHTPLPNRVRDWWRQGPGHPPPPRVEVWAPAGCLAVRRRRDHSSLGVLCFRRRVPSRVHGAGPPPAGADFGTYRWPHPQESGRVLIRPYRLSVGTRHPPQSWCAAGGGDSRPARAWGPRGCLRSPRTGRALGGWPTSR